MTFPWEPVIQHSQLPSHSLHPLRALGTCPRLKAFLGVVKAVCVGDFCEGVLLIVWACLIQKEGGSQSAIKPHTHCGLLLRQQNLGLWVAGKDENESKSPTTQMTGGPCFLTAVPGEDRG